MNTFWTQFGTNVVDHHMHEEGAYGAPSHCSACLPHRGARRVPAAGLACPRLIKTPLGRHATRPEAAADVETALMGSRPAYRC